MAKPWKARLWLTAYPSSWNGHLQMRVHLPQHWFLLHVQKLKMPHTLDFCGGNSKNRYLDRLLHGARAAAKKRRQLSIWLDTRRRGLCQVGRDFVPWSSSDIISLNYFWIFPEAVINGTTTNSFRSQAAGMFRWIISDSRVSERMNGVVNLICWLPPSSSPSLCSFMFLLGTLFNPRSFFPFVVNTEVNISSPVSYFTIQIFFV